MIRIDDKVNCCGCNACVQVCPVECISMQSEREGFFYPEVDINKCINCGKCEKVCPFLHPSESRDPIKVYGMYSLDPHILADSSSGGVFGGIALYIVENGGIVFGAAYDDEFQVHHIGVDKIEDIKKLRHSKYVQSNIGNSFKEAEMNLENDRMVLFTGTHCQILGLKKYLKRDYDKLYLVDVICYGVPSPMVWRKHLEEVRQKSNSNLEKIVFRDKEYGWASNIRYQFSNEQDNHLLDSSQDLYSLGFNRDLFLRPSCYQCKVRGFSSGSHLTIGDFWKIKEGHPDEYNSMGVSAVTVNDEKGLHLFHRVSDNFYYFDSDINKVAAGNPMLFRSCTQPKIRNEFFDRLNQGERFDSLIKHYFKCGNNFLAIGSYNLRAIVHQLNRLIRKGGLQHISNSSIISIMSDPIPERQLVTMDNEYRKSAIEHDFYKLLAENLHTYDPNSYVLIDFLEERYDLIRYNGTLITKSEAFDDLHIKTEHENIMERLSDTTMSLWKEKCISYIQMLIEYFRPERIILVENYLSCNIGKASEHQTYPNIESIATINRRLKEYYDYFVDRSIGIKAVKLSSRDLEYTDRNSRYGCHEWYLNYEAYNDLADQIYSYLLEID